jgi:hypothetical protein
LLKSSGIAGLLFRWSFADVGAELLLDRRGRRYKPADKPLYLAGVILCWRLPRLNRRITQS